MFDFYANLNVYGTDPATIGDDMRIPLIAYTWEFERGWTATLSLEDSKLRGGGVNPANADVSNTLKSVARSPEIVAALGRSGDWGMFKISAALHQGVVKGAAHENEDGNASPFSTDNASFWGYAVQAGIMLNLPQIASGDTLYLQTAYANGATSYLGLVNASGDFTPPDAFRDAGGGFSRVTGWNATFQYLHNFSPNWNAALFGGYARFELNNAEAEHTIGASGGINYNIGGNILWQPNAAFNVTLQYDYNMYEAVNYRNTGHGLPVRAQGASQVLLMSQRLF